VFEDSGNNHTKGKKMHLKEVRISGFKSISNDIPQKIFLEDNMTVFIGSNGTGKSTVMEALCKLFSLDQNMRGLRVNDFYNNAGNEQLNKSLCVEAWFGFSKANADKLTIPPLLENLTFDDRSGEVIFRIRLEGTLTYDTNPLGDIDENIYIISSNDDEPVEDDKFKCSASIRNAIQLSYVPANRDPLTQLKYSSKAVLGRLLKSIEWSSESRGVFEKHANNLNSLTDENPAFAEIAASINKSWSSIYKGRFLSQALLKFPISNIDEILKLLQLQFTPDELGSKIDVEKLSDGQKSLVYFSLIKAMFDIDKNAREFLTKGEPCNFNHEKMRLPIFSMICLEEPENHLSPHYIGRIIRLVKEYGMYDFCQVILSSHSSSILSRIEPETVRHFRIDNEKNSTFISKLTFPDDADEASKFIKEAVKAYPEIYFAKLIIFGEGDSEEVIIPKLLELNSKNVDANSIAVVPLGGRHVNHFWSLMKDLQIPFITLLDFDIDRNGGGFGRMKYAIDQILENDSDVTGYVNDSIKDLIPSWDSASNPKDFTIKYDPGKPEETVKNISQLLERNNVFFSYPLDIDYSMISCFPKIYCEKDESFDERGPNKVSADNEGELIKSVLKKGNTGIRFNFGENYLEYFSWYRYRFLSNKSKPASHIRMLLKVFSTYGDEEIIAMLPSELKRLLDKATEILEGTLE
jgi:predicted ATP-dependent endonuclease of OLD family